MINDILGYAVIIANPMKHELYEQLLNFTEEYHLK